MLPLYRCQQKLAAIWFLGGGFTFTMVVIQTLLGHYGEQANDAWAWLSPAIFPTLALMIGVLARQSHADATVDKFFYRLSFGLSASYLLLLNAVILLQPLEPASNGTPAEVLKHTSIFLGPFQGLITASLAVFFGQAKVSQDDDSKTGDATAAS